MKHPVLAALGVLLGLAVLIAGGFGLRWVLAGPEGATQAREQTVGDGSYRIQAYDQFFAQCAAAQTTQQNLELAREQATAEGLDPQRQAQLDANVIALTATLNRAVNDYNADAAREATAGQFRDSSLPYTISTNGPITCAL